MMVLIPYKVLGNQETPHKEVCGLSRPQKASIFDQSGLWSSLEVRGIGAHKTVLEINGCQNYG